MREMSRINDIAGTLLFLYITASAVSYVDSIQTEHRQTDIKVEAKRSLVGAEACEPEPFDMVMLIDRTSNVHENRELFELLATDIVTQIPNDSRSYLNWAGQHVEEIETVVKPHLNSSWVNKLYNPVDIKQYGDTISSEAVKDEIEDRFSVSQYKTRAEIVIILVDADTKIDSNYLQELSKKKTFVVVFGTVISKIWKTVATGDNHLYLIKGRGDLKNVTENIIRQIVYDSTQYCDTDSYSQKKGQKCKSCWNVCRKDLKNPTCKIRCPYLRLWSQEEHTVHPTLTTLGKGTHSPGDRFVEDNKTSVIVIVVVVLAVLLLLLVIAVIMCCIRKKNLTPGNSNQSLRPMEMMPLSPAVQESVPRTAEGERTPMVSIINNHSIVTIPVEDSVDNGTAQDQHTIPDTATTCTATDSQDENESISLNFKNGRELDANGYYFGGNVHVLHE